MDFKKIAKFPPGLENRKNKGKHYDLGNEK
jgi:hypothetical protein